MNRRDPSSILIDASLLLSRSVAPIVAVVNLDDEKKKNSNRLSDTRQVN